MAEIREHPCYKDDIRYAASLSVPWEKLEGRKVLITGASGLIGTVLVDVLMERNRTHHQNITVISVGRSEEKAKNRFSLFWNDPNFRFLSWDVNQFGPKEQADILIHAASNTHPVQYSTDPIGTVLTNIEGTKNILEMARRGGSERVVFLSSVEIYGENRGDTEYFEETYCGYIDCNTLRAGYPEGKRAGEALCQAYRKQYGMDIVIPRLSRTYGPTMSEGDSKAIAQFIRKGTAGKDIVLKSEGNQLFSYSYVADAVTGILYVMLLGTDGTAYNISDKKSDITLKGLSEMIAQFAGTRVVFDLPDETERAGYSKATKAVLDSSRLQKLGWSAKYGMEEGLKRTLEMLSYKGV